MERGGGGEETEKDEVALRNDGRREGVTKKELKNENSEQKKK